MDCDPCPEFPTGIKPTGTTIRHPEAFKLVQMGVAEPADAECHAAHGMTQQQIQAAQAAYEKVSRGIHPDDYDAFDRGEMVGYDGNGEPIPGPNAIDDYDPDACEDEEGVDDE